MSERFDEYSVAYIRELSTWLKAGGNALIVQSLIYLWIWNWSVSGVVCGMIAWVMIILGWVLAPRQAEKREAIQKAAAVTDCGHQNCGICALKGKPCPAKCEQYVVSVSGSECGQRSNFAVDKKFKEAGQ